MIPTTDTTEIDKLIAMFGPQEDLDPELVDYLQEGRLGLMIRHPLVYSIMHIDQLNGRMNRMLREKKEELVIAETKRDWYTFCYLHERPWRLQGFQKVMDRMTDRQYWRLLGSLWIDSENIPAFADEWQELMLSERPYRWVIMTAAERKALAKMHARFTVWQGHTSERDDGMSWTVDRGVAEWFARRFADLEGGIPRLSTGTVRRDAVVAYFARRNEAEVIVDRHHVEVTRTERL